MPTLFPHLTATGEPPLPREVWQAYKDLFYERLANGEIKPLVLPYHLYGILPVAIYLCISHKQRPWLYRARWLVFAGTMWFQVKTMRESSSRSSANGFASGLVASWGMVWAATWLIFERPQFDGRRVRRRRRVRRESDAGRVVLEKEVENGRTEGQTSGVEVSVEELKNRKRTNGHSEGQKMNGHAVEELDDGKKINGLVEGQEVNGHANHTPESSEIPDIPAKNTSEDDDEWEYYWQPYPSKMSERVSWLSDLLLSFREPGWNYAIPPLPPLSTSFKTSTGELLFPPQPKSAKKSRNTLLPFKTRGELAMYRVPRFIIGYFLLDIIKTTMLHDPYFLFGPTTYALPPHLAWLHPWVLKVMRQSLGAAGIIVAIELIFSIPPMLTILVPHSWNLPLTWTPPYFPSTWGSASALLDQGLGGLWGTWWHQTFRLGFSAPYSWALREGYLQPRTVSARLFSVVCAFGISSLLHASGSFTEVADTKPLHAPVFFLSQALGVILQTTGTSYFKPQIVKLPLWLRRTGNVLFILLWMHLFGSWLIDDFSRCKIWLFEPVLLSYARGLGFGKGEPAGWGSFWLGSRWEPIGLRWYSGKHWWESGIAI